MKEFLEIRIMRHKRRKKDGMTVMWNYCVIDEYVHMEPKEAMEKAVKMADRVSHAAWPTIRRPQTWEALKQ